MGGKGLFRGILDGAAAGKTALDMVSGINAVVRGRPASGAPARLVPLAVTGVSDPRSWSTADWTADAVAHLAHGLTTHGALDALEDTAATPPPPPARASTLLRAAALGIATGARSTAGVAALACTSRATDNGRIAAWSGSRPGTVLALLASAGELVADKLPSTPGRSQPEGLTPRVLLGATAAAGVAGREGDSPDLPVLVAVGTSVATALLGEHLRGRMAHRFGSDLPGAIIEDVVTALLAFLGARR